MSEPIDFENSPIVLLVIENKQLFRKTILSNYHNNESELFVFSEDYKPIDFSKKIKFIDDILTFEFADKKLMAKVNASFEAMCNIKFFNEISQLKESCYSMCESLAEEYDFDFDGYDVEISIVAENPRHIFFPRNLFEAISAKSNY